MEDGVPAEGEAKGGEGESGGDGGAEGGRPSSRRRVSFGAEATKPAPLSFSFRVDSVFFCAAS